MMWLGIPRAVPFKLRPVLGGSADPRAVMEITKGNLGVYDPPGRFSFFTCITRIPGVHVNGCHRSNTSP